MTAAGSGLFTSGRVGPPHLQRSHGALSGDDVAEILKPMASITIEEWTNLAASDDDAIKLSIASSASDQTYSTTGLDGVLGVGKMSPPRNVIITTTSHANIDAVGVVITGKDINGNVMTETITLTNGGGVVDSGSKTFAYITSILVPAQSGTGGALKFGFGNKIGLSKKIKARAGLAALLQEIVGGSVIRPPADFAPDEWTDPAAVSTTALLTATATTIAVQTILAAALTAGGKTALLTYSRNLTFTTGGTATDAPASVVITGTDINGAALTETLVLSQSAGTDQGVKAFKTVTSIVYGAGVGAGGTVAIGIGKKFGLSRPLKLRAGATKVVQEIAIGVVVTTGTVVLPATSPPNGTYAPSANPNGSTDDFAIYYEAANSSSSMSNASVAVPYGAYVPAVSPDGLVDYAVFYEYDPTA